MSQRSPWLVDPNGPLDKLSWWFRPCQTMFWKISWNYDFTRKILYIPFQACRAFISIIWKDSMKILLLPIYYIVIWNYYLIYATFIYVCCDSFRIYCRGAKYSFFLEILSVIWTKKILVKFLPTPLSQSWSIEPEKSNPPKKILTPSLFFENQNLSKKIFLVKWDQKKKTKRKKLTLENFVPTLKNGLQTKILGWCNFSCKVSFYSESINVQITSATI